MTVSNEYDSIVDASPNEKQSFAPSAAVPAKKLLIGFSMAAMALLGCTYAKVTSLEEKVDKMAGLRSAGGGGAGGVHPVKENQQVEPYLSLFAVCVRTGLEDEVESCKRLATQRAIYTDGYSADDAKIRLDYYAKYYVEDCTKIKTDCEWMAERYMYCRVNQYFGDESEEKCATYVAEM